MKRSLNPQKHYLSWLPIYRELQYYMKNKKHNQIIHVSDTHIIIRLTQTIL